MAISAVILAAGMARRMGRQKLLLKMGTKTIIEHVVENALRSKIKENIVVLPKDDQDITRLLCNYPVKIIYNTKYQDGQGTSVACGAHAVDASSQGIMYLLGDQPLIGPNIINILTDKFHDISPLIIRPQGTGNPTIFNIKLLGELKELSGDVGGRQLIERYRSMVVYVPMNLGNLSMDVDTKEDYQKLLHLWAKLH